MTFGGCSEDPCDTGGTIGLIKGDPNQKRSHMQFSQGVTAPLVGLKPANHFFPNSLAAERHLNKTQACCCGEMPLVEAPNLIGSLDLGKD